jgi:hypothetical protein
VFDIIISIAFLISLYILECFERIDYKILNKSILKVEDFTVTVKNLPLKESYKSIKELKAILWNKLEDIVKKEE